MQVVGDAHVRVDRQVFRQVAQNVLHLPRLFGQVDAIDADSPGRGLQVAAEHFHDGSFAGAVVAQQADDFAWRYMKADSVHGEAIAIGTGELFDFNHLLLRRNLQTDQEKNSSLIIKATSTIFSTVLTMPSPCLICTWAPIQPPMELPTARAAPTIQRISTREAKTISATAV